MDNFGEQFGSGLVANGVFVILFAVGKWIQSRLQNSDCHLDCGWLSCDSSLSELNHIKTHLTETQRYQAGMLQKIIKQIGIKPEPIGENIV